MTYSTSFYTIVHLFELIFTFYLIVIGLFYALGTIYSYFKNKNYFKYQQLYPFSSLVNSPYASGVSLIAPAFNESQTIVDNTRSLLTLEYGKMEIIVVNDGSSDDSIEKLKDEFELYPIVFHQDGCLPTKAIRDVFKSKNKAFSNLIVVDKENGGKSDALNAGISLASYDVVGCMDVDSILMRDGIQKLINPFLMDAAVIAVGASIRIANRCEIAHGHLARINFPNKMIVRFQVLEYLRSFLIGRMSWSGINGLLLISGAIGLFRKDIVKAVGGYRTDVVGEDLELIVRMRRFMYDHKRKHKVVNLPDPVCWTEAPSTSQILARQRNRWSRGAMESLWIHRKMFLNPKYGITGLISFPYWVICEWLSPVFELVGVFLLICYTLFGMVDSSQLLTLTGLAFSIAMTISIMSIIIEETTYRMYRKRKDILYLFLTALLEPFIYHPRVIWWSLTGTWDKLTGVKKGWGTMTRVGFKS